MDVTTRNLESVLGNLPSIERTCAELRDTILANLIMIGESPAPTFGEQERVTFLCNRFTECGLSDCCSDEMGNGFGVLPGITGESHILVAAHTDTIFGSETDHTITVEPHRIIGAGLGDNSAGVAALASLPTILEKLGIRLENDLLLMGSARSLGRGDLAGVRFFLKNNKFPIRAGVCVEGAGLGRLSYKSLGMVRCEATVAVPEEYDWTRFGAGSAIPVLNDLINKILAIPRPRRPRTTISLGAVSGGTSFSTTATSASLRFEVRSESSEQTHEIWSRIEESAEEIAADSGADIELTVVSHREPGGIDFSHPLVRTARTIMNALEIEDRAAPSTSELAALIDAGIPAVTLGLTHSRRTGKQDEELEIESIFTGLAQLLGTLLAIDGGLCGEH